MKYFSFYNKVPFKFPFPALSNSNYFTVSLCFPNHFIEQIFRKRMNIPFPNVTVTAAIYVTTFEAKMTQKGPSFVF